MIIIAVDPGKTAGFCMWREGDVSKWTQYELPATSALWHVEQSLVASVREEVIVVAERFTFTSLNHSREYDALEMIGALRYLAWKANKSFELQSRADKSRVSNQLLRKHGLQYPDGEGHAADAARHALVAIARHRPQSAIMQQIAGRI